jgi:hypothetical protein
MPAGSGTAYLVPSSLYFTKLYFTKHKPSKQLLLLLAGSKTNANKKKLNV